MGFDALRANVLGLRRQKIKCRALVLRSELL
jgi:hypothetical protein